MSGIVQDLLGVLRLDLLLALVLAVGLGGVIGLEREYRRKPVGFRTTILICLGSTLFTDLSMLLAGPTGDPARVAAQIVTGVGFLGAGTIIQSRGNVTGLTSAATIWLVSAIGMALGFGAYVEAVGATALVVLVLSGLGRLERFVGARSPSDTIHVEAAATTDVVANVERVVSEAALELEAMTVTSDGDRVSIELDLSGRRQRRAALRQALAALPDVRRVW